MNIKMIVTDLDKTLLRSNKTISEHTCMVLHRCQAVGIKVVFATARSENSSRKYIEQINPDAIISNGGALVRISDQTIYRATVDEPIANELIWCCQQERDVEFITVDTDKGYFVNKPIDETDPNWIEYLPAIYTDFSSGLGCDAYKITIQIANDASAHKIVSFFPTLSVIAFAGEGWYRFADNQADKWHGVMALQNQYGINVKETVAFGDDYNDVEMIRNCTGIAVANALDEVKAIADYNCESNNDDGVAQWLETNVLK